MSTAIHDIGYRHYDGPRLGRSHVARSLYLYNLRAVFGLGRGVRAKLIPLALAAFMILPAAGDIAVLSFTKTPEALIDYTMYAIYLQPIIAIFLATQAPVIASRDLRFRTVPLYFSRPVETTDFVLAKFAAFVTALLALMAVPVTLLHLGFLAVRGSMVDAGAPDVPSVADQSVYYLAALAGCLLFALVLSSFALLIATYTPRRGFGVAAVMAVYLISNVVVLIVQGASISNGNYDLAGWAGLFTPFNLVDGVQARLLGGDLGVRSGAAAPAGSGPVFLLACLAVVGVSLLLLMKRFRKAGA
ncbi:ABC transporter permease [Actinocorallia populi]|uniref:ABC transporter permease n=1 Tax=Actinocorallia populi TaxID=2079200 RepID=UPI000D0953C2|nr:ABC transporter permease [Actinocorallia populi]